MNLKFGQNIAGVFIILSMLLTNSIAGEILHGPARNGDAVTIKNGSLMIYREATENMSDVPLIIINGRVAAALLPGEFLQAKLCAHEVSLRIAARGNSANRGQAETIEIPKDSIAYVKIVQNADKTFSPIVIGKLQGERLYKHITTTSNVINRYIPKLVISTDNFFEFDSAELLDSSREEMDKLVQDITMCPDQADVLHITGHTDRIGTDSYNDVLSLQRAQAVADYLAKSGVETPLEVEGRGSREPITTDCVGERSAELIECLQPDRRVEIQ